MSSESVIEIENAVVAYNGATALSGVSLTVCAGECVALIGANGAGKTTLLTVVNGFTQLTSGRVRVFGATPKGMQAVRARRRIGYVAQAQPIDPRMPVSLLESVMTGVYGRLGWRRKPTQRDRALVRDILDSLQILPLAARPLGRLSGGEMRRAMIARCLAQEPDLMLLDEPTASLDDASCEAIMRIMEQAHRERGTTMLWVTHDLDALPPCCTRTLRLRNGALAEDLSHAPACKRKDP
ncbi:MAG TPA: metal ABC transporter ATP-binding protein [Candidatus Hydrogenedentes bacterium]|nr:metal ABC transporter ATP-binding protein [Candidatus Hydrogenedentota bacterium]